MPQSEEHLAAVHALGITYGLLAVTRSDLAGPEDARRQALARLAASSLGEVEAVAVSARTGLGLAALREALDRLAGRLPHPDPAAPVRLWVDRAFRIKGSGTVVTGTLPAGTIRARQELLLTPSMEPLRVRGIETLKQAATQVSGVARVALNLRGAERLTPARGMALITPGRWTLAATVDVRLASAGGRPPRQLTVHAGSARTAARLRPLGGLIARLTLDEPLPLHVGDRLLLRDPGSAAVAFAGPARGHQRRDGERSGPVVVATAGGRDRAGCGPARVPPARGGRRGRPGTRRLARPARRGRPAATARAAARRRTAGHGADRAARPRRWRLAGRPAALGGAGPAAQEERRRARRAGAAGAGPAARGGPGPAGAALPPAGQAARRAAADGAGRVGDARERAGSGPALPDRVLAAVRLLRDDLDSQPFAAPQAGSASSGWTAGRWRRRPGPGCCCGWPIRSCWRRMRTAKRPASWRGCPGRSRRPRPARCCTPPAGWRSRCWSTWTAAGSPAGCPTTGARSPHHGDRSAAGHHGDQVSGR